MYKHILVALDGRPESEQALKQAIDLAHAGGASLTAISVIEGLPAYAASVGEVQEVKEESERFFTKLQHSAVQSAEARGVVLKTVIRAGHAAQSIARYAEETGADLIVVGSDRQRGLGSTADRITETATCSVLVARVSLPSVRVKDAMTREVMSIGPSTSLSQVVELLDEKGIKSIPVMEQGKIVGIITGGDLLARTNMGLRLSLHESLPAAVLSDQIRRLAEEGKTAKDVMTSPVVTISEDEHITRAAALMNEKNIKRVPVLNKQGELVGIISRLDILELVASEGASSELFPGMNGVSARTAGDIMFRDVPTVGPDASLNEVVNKILSTPLRRVVVTDEERRILGTIADRDLIKAVPRGKTGALQSILSFLSHTPSGVLDLTGEAREVMEKDVFTVGPDAPLGEVIQTMIEKRVKRLVVADQQRRLVGMVSRESILHAMAGKRAGTS
jgi:CBS domain-containing protein/nucleotide-binding universal stress UspA family protein